MECMEGVKEPSRFYTKFINSLILISTSCSSVDLPYTCIYMNPIVP